MKKTVIVLGTWSSGSGAVSDYLSSRHDFISPYGKNEFKLISDPGGLNYLYKNLYSSNDLLIPSYAYEQFNLYINNLEKYYVYSDYGRKVRLFDKKLIFLKNKFLKKIIKFKYLGWPHYKDLSQTFSDKVKRKIKVRIFNKKLFEIYKYPLITPVDKKKFVLYSREFISDIIKSSSKININSKNVILNNGADICDPITSTQYYKNRKIICVTRDPRDIFCGMKLRRANSTPWHDVKIFVKWYAHYFGNKNFQNILNQKLILRIKFENFINNFDKENRKICKFLGIKSKIKFKDKKLFDLEESKKNIYKSKFYLNKKELHLIERELKEYLQW